MVTEFGMTDALGPQQLGARPHEPFLGREMGAPRDYSDEVAAKVDAEVRTLIDNAHEEARQILRQHRKVLDRMADALCERETLDTPELLEIFGDLPTWESVTANGNGTTTTRRRRTTKSSAS
jgi:cell division protease FtsH